MAIGEPDQSRVLGRKLTASNITMMSSRAPAAVLLIRLAVGGVFLFEGIQKFLFPMEMGPGLFAKLGIPAPGLLAPLAGLIEVVCGALLIAALAAILYARAMYQRAKLVPPHISRALAEHDSAREE